MKAWVIVILLVISGIVGAWVGYWVGDALGWATDAEFPLQIGGGAGAIGLSILFSFGFVMAGAGWLIARPLRNIRRVAETGASARATVRRAWRTGLYINRGGDAPRHEVAFEVEVHPGEGGDYAAKAMGVLTAAEEAALVPGAEARSLRSGAPDPRGRDRAGRIAGLAAGPAAASGIGPARPGDARYEAGSAAGDAWSPVTAGAPGSPASAAAPY